MALPRPQLLVLVDGLGPDQLAELPRDLLHPAPPVPLTDLPEDPLPALRGAAPVQTLGDLGIDVDRQGLLLRPEHADDATTIAALARRPVGPAPVTVLWLRDAGRTAERHGLDRARQVRLVADHLRTAAAILRRGDLPEIWCLGAGATQPVHTTFDLAAAFRRRLPPPLGDALRVQVTLATAVVHAADQQALRVAAAVLAEPPFRQHGALVVAPTRLLLRAAPGIAFATTQVGARPPHPGEGTAAVCCPWPAAVPAAIGYRPLLATFWASAAERHAPAEPITAGTPDSRSTARTVAEVPSPPGWTAAESASRTATSQTASGSSAPTSR